MVVLICMAVFITGCTKKEYSIFEPNANDSNSSLKDVSVIEKDNLLNKEKMTIGERYKTPTAFNRVDVEKDGFAEFLRNSKLKTYGKKVLYYDGREKNKTGVYDSVFDMETGDRDLHQCADAIMLLRAEYLYSIGKYEDISFNFVSGFKAEYKKWMEGYRIKIEGNNAYYYKATESSNSYEAFRKFMDLVFAYSSTLSLDKQLKSVEVPDIQIGDVFIIGGSPGHAIIVVDMAANEEGEKIFMLAQSYMPAQQTQLLVNPMDDKISPWFSLKDKEKLITPEWTFDLDKLKRF